MVGAGRDVFGRPGPVVPSPAMKNHRLAAAFLLSALASALPSQGPACAGLEQHAYLAAGAVSEASFAPRSAGGELVVHGAPSARVRIRVFDASGRLLEELVNHGAVGRVTIPSGQPVRVELANLATEGCSLVVQAW